MVNAPASSGWFSWMPPVVLLAVLAVAFARWQTTLIQHQLDDLGRDTATQIALIASHDPSAAGMLATAGVAVPRIHAIEIALPGQAERLYGVLPARSELRAHSVPVPGGGRVVVSTAAPGWIALAPLLIAILTGAAVMAALWLTVHMRRREHATLDSLRRLLRDFDAVEAGTGGPHIDDLQAGLDEIAQRVRALRSDVRDESRRSMANLPSPGTHLEDQNPELEMAGRQALVAGQAKSEFLASISHEVRTPMDAILGYKDLLGETPLDARQRSYLNAIEQAAENLLDIIDDVLSLSRIEAGRLSIHDQPFSLRENADSVAEMLAPAAYRKKLDFIRVVAADVPETVRGDPLRVRQILVNLLTNAIKFTRNGHVRLHIAAPVQQDGIAQIAFTVSDTGIGISADEQKALFQPFSRPARAAHDEQGAGLGLAITKRLCEAMHGSISVTSAPGRGSSFTARVPMPVIEESLPAASASALSGRIIAVHCGDEALSAWLCECLVADGAEVTRTISTSALIDALASEASRWSLLVLVIGQRVLNDEARLAELRAVVAGKLRTVCLVSTSSRYELRRIEGLFGGEALSAHVSERIICEHVAATLWHRGRDAGPVLALPAVSAARPLDGLRLLVAEDNRLSQDYLRTLLSRSGATVDVCANGARACEMIAAQDYDLVLMDLRMPVCNGFEAMRRLRSRSQPTPPILGLTAAADDCDAARAAGMRECLLKPVRVPVLLDFIATECARGAKPSPGATFLDDEMRAELRVELPRHATRLGELLQAREFDALLEEAHRVNGTAALCGLAALRARAAHLEGKLRRREFDDLDEALAQVVAEIDAACVQLTPDA